MKPDPLIAYEAWTGFYQHFLRDNMLSPEAQKAAGVIDRELAGRIEVTLQDEKS